MPTNHRFPAHFRQMLFVAAIFAWSSLHMGPAACRRHIWKSFRSYQRRQPVTSAPPMAYANPWGDISGFEISPAEAARPTGPTVTYCVRLCDGRYFPVQRQAASSSPAKICTAQCPASQTKILTGAGIDNAIGLDGARYSSLENAFVYRERVVSDCTCNGKDPYGLAPIAIHSDPTLQRGDIVVTDKGPVAFVGDHRLPHRAAKFTPVKNSPAVSDSLRKQLSSSACRTAVEPRALVARTLAAINARERQRGDTGSSLNPGELHPLSHGPGTNRTVKRHVTNTRGPGTRPSPPLQHTKGAATS